jgi:hypothetical protein
VSTLHCPKKRGEKQTQKTVEKQDTFGREVKEEEEGGGRGGGGGERERERERIKRGYREKKTEKK